MYVAIAMYSSTGHADVRSYHAMILYVVNNLRVQLIAHHAFSMLHAEIIYNDIHFHYIYACMHAWANYKTSSTTSHPMIS